MPKKWVHGGINPEGTSFPVEVEFVKIKKTKDGVPEPPPNFLPVGKAKIVPLGQSLSLHKPRDVGIPDWLKREDK